MKPDYTGRAGGQFVMETPHHAGNFGKNKTVNGGRTVSADCVTIAQKCSGHPIKLPHE